MTRRSQMIGRHELARVPEPASGYPALPTSRHNNAASITPVVVEDAYDRTRRHRAVARVDLLDRERRARRIDEASYLVGREVERVFEHMVRVSGGGQWCEGDRMDPATQAEVAALLGIEKAFKVNAFLGWMLRHIGRQDTRLLWIILGNRLSFATAASAFGRRGVRGLRYTMDRFADALSALADAKAARGKAVR